MIPIQRRPEPLAFDSTVRQPGLAWLAKKGIDTAQPVPEKFNWKALWRESNADLHQSYDGVCAYACCWIPQITGSRTVEHVRPKKRYPGLAYEWTNYLLVCGTLNGRKGAHEDVLNPFELPDSPFELDLASGRISAKQGPLATEAQATIKRLRLDDEECRVMRRQYWEEYARREISSDFLKRRSPFVWAEADRQGLL
jgi:uncharacterized protein (TIGR02646 family)